MRSTGGFAGRALASPCFVLGAALICVLLALVLVGFVYTPYPPNQIDRDAMSQPPGFAHWFGTDNLGRDIFSRVMYAGRTSFATGLCAAGICLVAGTLLGLAAGAADNRAAYAADIVLTRFTDIMRCIPAVLFAMMVIAVLGASFINTVLAISFIFIPSFFRIVRGGVIQIKGREYIIWARLAGVGRWRILLLHVLPNLASQLTVLVSLTVAQAVLTETALTYLGLGVQPPDPSWGRMLSEAQRGIMTAPWEAVSVGVCISVMALGFNLLGDGLRDVLDVRG